MTIQPCPKPSEIEAFNSGVCPTDERRRLVVHFASCETCRSAVLAPQIKAASSRRLHGHLIRIAAVCGGVLLLAGLYTRYRAGPSVPPVRVIEGRLSGGFAWAPFRPDAHRRVAAGGSLSTRGGSRPAAHAIAIHQLIVSGSARSLSTLLAIPQSSYDAATWNDLAAVYISRGNETDTPAQFVEAVAAADAALKIDPTLAEARFNRALAIEYLRLRDVAAEAWRQYLLIDTSGPWAQEATQHLQNVSALLPDFGRALGRSRRAVALGDVQEARRLVAISPLDARLFVETDALARWGDTVGTNESLAAEQLAIGRCIASELRSRGDSTMADAVDAIARVPASGRSGLARAHSTLARARQLIKSAPTGAEPLLREASLLFAAAHSPMSALADYYAAIAVFDEGRRTDSARELRAILPRVPETHRSLRALVLWQLGLCEGAVANWGSTLHALNESAELFKQIGETKNTAFVRQILSEVYDAIGDHETAWKYRATVMAELGSTTNSRTETAVAAIAYDAAQRKRWRVALSMLNLEIEIARSVRLPPQEVLAYLRSAVAKSHLGDAAGAARDLAAARRTAGSIGDPALRERAEADIAMIGWMDAVTPQDALRRLTAALDFHQKSGRDMYLPVLHLQRARAYRELGNAGAARAELESGIARLERDRQTLPGAAARLGIFDTSSDLFEEAIALALARGDVSEAFRYAERAHARSLLDLLDASPMTIDEQSVPERTAIVEFSSTADRLITFVLTREGLHAVRSELAPADIAAAASRMREVLAHGDDAEADREARTLHEELIVPIAGFIRDKSDLVFVPSAETAALSFGALRAQDGSYLLERYSVAIAPSAAVYRSIRPWRPRPDPTALVVAAAFTGADRAPLAAARTEAENVAREYRHATLLEDEQATTEEFTRRVPGADIVHFAGHGLSKGDDGSGDTLLSTFDPTAGDALTAKRIESMKLPRAPLVILAACNTARGEVRWSEGTLSVARAFLAAGAPAVVATLWPIDDAQSAEFFPRLHAHLARGLSVAEALRETQLELIRKPGASPSMWAAVEVIGR